MLNMQKMAKVHFLASLASKFFKETPVSAFLVTLSSISSQIGLMLASLLPLKVLLLIGTSSVPRYFPGFLEGVNKNTLVISLCVLALVSFLIHLLSESLVYRFSLKGARKIVLVNQKSLLYQQQKKIAETSYKKVTACASALIFMLFVAMYLLWYDLYLAVGVLLITTLVFYCLILKERWGKGKLKKESKVLLLVPHAKSGSIVCFLMSFMLTAYLFLVTGGENIIGAIIALLLLRQGFSRFPLLISNIAWLDAKKENLKALFYESHLVNTAPAKVERDFPRYFVSKKFKQDILEFLSEQYSLNGSINKIDLLKDSGKSGYELIVKVKTDNLYETVLLVKAYPESRRRIENHEAILLEHDLEKSIPMPEYLGASSGCGDEVFLYFYNVTGLNVLIGKSDEYFARMYKSFLSYQPGEAVIYLYSGSNALLYQRLNKDNFLYLRRISDLVQEKVCKKDIDYIAQNFDRTLSVVMNMPLFLYVPSRPEFLWEKKNEEVLVSDWGGWSVDVIGSGWPTSSKLYDKQKEVFEEWRAVQKYAVDIDFFEFRLVSLLFYFDAYFRKQEYLQAISLVPEISSVVEKVVSPAKGVGS